MPHALCEERHTPGHQTGPREIVVCCPSGQNRNLKHQQLSDCLCQTNVLSKLNPLTNSRMFVDRDGSKTNNDLTLVGRGLFVRPVFVCIHGIGMIVKTTSREEIEGGDCLLESVSEYTYTWTGKLLPEKRMRVMIASPCLPEASLQVLTLCFCCFIIQPHSDI